MKKLEQMADKLRIHSIEETTAAGSGHPTSCMSCAEIMSALFFSVMKKEDEFIMSKGHAAPILWAAYAEAGIVKKSELTNLRKIDSPLEGHPTPNMPMITVATGSLGQGLPAGVGMALAKRLQKSEGKVYVLMGDGESAEGSVWEAANTAAHHKLADLCAIVDVNRLGQSQQTMHGHDVKVYQKKFEAFGWDAIVVDGHSIPALLKALKRSRSRPLALIAKTYKGKGFKDVEDKLGWHGKPFPKDLAQRAIEKIGTPHVKMHSAVELVKRTPPRFVDYRRNTYTLGNTVPTRAAFGTALATLGERNKHVVAIDGDVKNSTYTDRFFKAFPNRSFESYIAEQNMAGMAIGLSAMGYSPFVATFATFFTRAHDFIRMAAYSRSNIKFVGSHVGVSIGEDGASQMGLEDLSMFTGIPDAVVLYPCDAVSTEYLVKEMAQHHGISYLRTTREKTPVIYSNEEKFPMGGLKVLKKSKKDRVLVIGAGITVHEALKAHAALQKKKINIRVIDLYSIKPVDRRALKKHAKECKDRVVVVEDHYFGGVGPVVSEHVGIEHLYVKGTPRSGKPEELRKMFGIDSSAIIKTVRKLLR